MADVRADSCWSECVVEDNCDQDGWQWRTLFQHGVESFLDLFLGFDLAFHIKQRFVVQNDREKAG